MDEDFDALVWFDPEQASDSRDYIATVIGEEFPALTFEVIDDLPPSRCGLLIIVPPQFTEMGELRRRVIEMRDKTFWDRGVLFAYEFVEASE